MTEIQDRDPLDGTGFQDGPPATWVKFTLFDAGDYKDKCRMVVGKDGPSTDSFVGQLITASRPKWKEASGKIPAHHEYIFTARAKNKDGEVKNYNFTLSSHWKSPILSDILNPLLWLAKEKAAGRHNGLFKLNSYQKMGGNGMYVMRAGLYDPNNAGSQDFMPGKFPWVGTKTDGKFVGVPEPTTDAAGQKDFSSIAKFWHEQWEELVNILSGTQAAQPAPAPKPPAPATMPRNEPPDGSFSGGTVKPQVVVGALAWFEKNWDGQAPTFMEWVGKTFASCKSPNRAVPVTMLELDALADAFNDLAAQKFIVFPTGMIINAEGNLAPDPRSGFQSPAAALPTTPPSDDTPF